MTTSRESLTLISALLQIHQITDRAALLPVLVHALAAEHGPTAAVAYLPDAGAPGLKLALSAAAGLSLSADEQETHGFPALAQESAAQALQLLSVDTPPAGSLSYATEGLWSAGAAAQVEASLGVTLAAAAPVRTAFGPSGFVLLLFLGDCPAEVASGAAAHTAAALSRLLDRELEQEQEGGAIVTGEIESIAGREVSRAQRYGRVLSVSILERSDEGVPGPLLALTARMMRRPDTAGLLEDGRIVALLPETPPEGAASFLRRLYERSSAEGFALRGGSASYPDDGASFAALLGRAAERLRALEPSALAEAEALESPDEYVPANTIPIAAGRGLATVGIRIAPISDSEIASWRNLLQRLPSVVSADACGFDGLSGTFNVTAPSVTRLLVDLQGVAAKMDARLSPTITGEVSIALRESGARPREMRVASGGIRPLREALVPNGTGTVATLAPPAAEGTEATAAPPARRVPAPPPPAPPPLPEQPKRKARQARGGGRINFNRPGLALLIAIPVVVLAILGVARLMRDETPAASTFVPPSPAAAASAQASPVAVATAVPTASATRVLARDLTGGCLPEPGTAACDELRAGLWSGDAQAWQRWLQSLGRPAPSRNEVFEGVFSMRLAVNDPAARQDIARSANAPLPLIAAVTATEGSPARLTAVELINFGYAPANLAGVVLPGGLGTISAGATLPSGARCVIGATPEQTTCSFAATGAQPVDVKTGDALRLVAAGGGDLDVWAMP